MDKQTKNKIKSMVLVLREDFEKEIANRLNNMGISPDREWKDGRSLPHLSEDEIGRNELEKRRRIAAFITREIKAGQGQKAATEEFIREASYTWINRLIGLKCLESQDLIEEVITTRPEYGNRSKQHRDFREKNPEAASKPDDGLIGCLFSAFEAITEEIRVLFDPKDEYSLIIPRYPVLKNAIEKINTELDYETYQADDFLGWVYQYFNSKEKDRVFEEVKTKKKKISGNDIINATQLYTEKYMVHFLVENSLGAMWMEMYPDSPLSSRWEYFVKDPNNTTRETKPVKDIKFLDPACGSGHFLLYAFDLFYTMYEEEGIIPRNQIPEFILRNNLHGIDIDQRAIQLSALGLYMKAKSKNNHMKVQQMNIVSANAVMLNSEILEEFLQDFKDDKVAQELITAIWHGLANVRELGSLLKIEEQIDEVIKKQKGTKLDFYIEDGAKNWIQWKHDLLKAIKKYYKKASEILDINKQLFANEAYKGVQLLDLLEQKYDIVTTNPPYMHNRNMGNKLKSSLKVLYPKTSRDLYVAFITRCLQLTAINGFTSMITQQSFMFISSYADVRKFILNNSVIRNMAHLGTRSFEDIEGEFVNTTMFSLHKCSQKSGVYSVFFRLINKDDKNLYLKHSINDFNNNYTDSLSFVLSQKKFEIIPNSPFVYWISDRIRNLFTLSLQLGDVIEFANRTKTSNNDLYTRYYWEPKDSIGKNCKWVFYTKGGDFNRWYGNNDILINWSQEARDFFRNSSDGRITDEIYWFREGITYGATSGKGFSARYIPPYCVYDVKGPAIFLKNDWKLHFLLGLFDSKIISYLLNILNPTIEVQSGDIERLPVSFFHEECRNNISKLAELCCKIKRNSIQYTINDAEFKQTSIQWGYNKQFKGQ